MNRKDLQKAIGLLDAEHFRKSYINQVLGIKVIEMTVPEKPASSKQRYRISGIGKQLLEKLRDKGET
ncbi:Fic family protein [Methanospirillum sp.]